MLVSIITATFNSSKYIRETYNSIVKQNYDNWEWIITDDCSTDNTLDILKIISQEDSRVKVFFNDINSGAAVSRNNCLDHIEGDYIAFLDSDDLWEFDKLSTQIKFMIETGAKFSFTSYELINEMGVNQNVTIDDQPLTKVSYEQMLRKTATLGCSTVILHSSLVLNTRMPLLRTGQDYAFWLKILKKNEYAYLLRKSLTKYRITPGSISRNKFKKSLRQWEIYREVERLNIVKSSVCFCFYAYRAIFRK
ncbi:putative N-acetylgalactosaminyl-diphosphoundecaprenol glucuronosyltransferase [Vibrio fluvialis PG41]|uniref:Putative N-acetylgalactosaminyl-diphosphoundecaprenol glucuronosyltransferase n=1 Tax=Vibrio fluvialis PG41 TaxID=1336752 RepID=S7IC63_VIBFL|nr:glycosyltransferase family 2 protein [Vibrio fluvialis]EPP25477.1 putative N-acetylgalactosaminyl-diphosphoundecaprenol glucuronosyltransferase [Vibrio fluvialis PG41]